MDIFSKTKRSSIMSRVRSRNTKLEILVRKELFSRGFRYRLYRKDLPGTPDIVLPKYRTVIFVNGCFWHSHQGCKLAALPKNNAAFWSEKIRNNTIRDQANYEALRCRSWRVLVVWQCATNKRSLSILGALIEHFLRHEECLYAEIGRAEIES